MHQKMSEYDTSRYTVVQTDRALLEDNSTYGPGYAVLNNSNGIVEATFMNLPNAIWTALQMTKGLDELLAEAPEDTLAAAGESNATVH